MPRPSNCWPGEDLDGYTEIYPESLLHAYWGSEVIDSNGVPSRRIIGVSDPFVVRFRLELVGQDWRGMVGDWVFDIRFDELGGPADFKLSSLLPPGALTVKNWKGDRTCVQLQYTVPANTVPDSVYELTSDFELRSSGKPKAIASFGPLKEYQWYL